MNFSEINTLLHVFLNFSYNNVNILTTTLQNRYYKTTVYVMFSFQMLFYDRPRVLIVRENKFYCCPDKLIKLASITLLKPGALHFKLKL